MPPTDHPPVSSRSIEYPLDELLGWPRKKLCSLDADRLRSTAPVSSTGLIIGSVAAGLSLILTGLPMLAVVVFAAMVLNMGLAGLAGAFIPLFLKRLNLDPAQTSSIFLTTVIDIAGFFIFLSLGTWLLL